MYYFKGFVIILTALISAGLFTPAGAQSPLSLDAVKVDVPPAINGMADDTAWQNAQAIVVSDPIVNIPITLKSVHDGNAIYILVSFPDSDESRDHRSLHWDESNGVYMNGPEREDVLVLKWAIRPCTCGLTLKENNPYVADIWYWKAHRTDPVGYADDKSHHYSRVKTAKATPLISPQGMMFYLSRKGDAGTSAYSTIQYQDKQEPIMPKYTIAPPTGSRADVQAKGNWENGVWTVEFKRKLDTGHDDDVKLVPGKSHTFGVSRHEIAGRKKNPQSQQPQFGCGEVGELIELTVQETD